MRHALLLAASLFWVACSGPRCASSPSDPDDEGDEKSAASDGASLLVIDHVRVFDGEQVLEDRRVEIEGETIRAIGDVGEVPAGAEVVDGAGKTLLPGLIDAHVHVFDESHLRQALVFGVTTELDMLNLPSIFELRSAAAEDPTLAELRSTGSGITAKDGHGTQFMPNLDALEPDGDAAELVARRVDEGADFIKIIYDDLRAMNLEWPTLSRTQLDAAVAAAHEHDKPAVVHVSDARAARESAEAGADGLVHIWMDERAPEVTELVAERDLFVVPTLSVLTGHCDDPLGEALAADERLASYLAPGDAENLSSPQQFPPPLGCDELIAIAGDLADAGVTLLAGTDAPNTGTAHGVSMHGELALLVEAGLSPIEALRAATSAPAEAFGLDDRGRIAKGMRADLLLVEGDPTEDIDATRRIAGVWQAGVGLDRDALRDAHAEAADIDAEAVEAGLISDFEDGTLAAAFGAGWQAADDSVMGGESTVELEVVDGGADGTDKALRVSGEVADGHVAFAGVNFLPGQDFNVPADLSAHEAFSLFARGDGEPFTVMVFTLTNFRNPPAVEFVAGDEWERHRFAFEDFDDVDPAQISAIFIGATRSGPFFLELDEVVLGEPE